MSNKQNRLRELFDAALDLPAARRAAWLRDVCSGDPGLLAEVSALLIAHESDNTWLDNGVPAPASGLRQAGPYTLVEELGQGGMGTVYLGERTVGRVRQRVAVKIVRPGLASNAEVLRRFEQEREILASLDHPNIARMLDLGSTDDGVPYLVMEYVRGETIDDWSAARNAAVTEVLRLFCVACDALQYAHDHGVVHRDLKPGNMLVTQDGTLKLLDFGVARLLRIEGDARTLATATGPAPMTIEYASPEQIRGEQATAQSDVYSMGVVLFELLTGRRPFESQGHPMHEVAASICHDPPMAPSLAAPDDAMRRRLSGDLDAIILKAIRKDAAWRYSRPSELSADIRRHLDGLRVLARADTAKYRIERLIRRVFYPPEAAFQSPQGMLMWSAGVLGILLLVERHQILTGHRAGPHTVLDAIVLAVWLLWSIREGVRAARSGRFSVLDRQTWLVFTVITAVTGAVTVVSSVRGTIVPESMAIFWNTALAAGLLIAGLQASRLMTAGGIILVISAIVAATDRALVYLYLAGGLLAGMVIPGLIFTFRRPKAAAGS